MEHSASVDEDAGEKDTTSSSSESEEMNQDPPLNAAEYALHARGIAGNIASSAVEEEDFQIPPKPENPEDEGELITSLERKYQSHNSMKVGDKWYILDSIWYKKWREYVGLDARRYEVLREPKEPPGPINNTKLLEDGTDRIKKTLMETFDYLLVAKNVWKCFWAWYGGGPELERFVISSGYSKSIEVRPLQLRVYKSSAMTEGIVVSFSKAATVGEFKVKMCEKLGIPNPNDVRVWDFHGHSRYKCLEDEEDRRLESVQIIDGQDMLLEEKDPETGKFPEYKAKYRDSHQQFFNSTVDKGCTGLMNLGNTCFMNSSLQCLSNTGPLTEYFLSDRWKDEVNRDNPLGMKGEIAEEYADLLKELWSQKPYYPPREFKSKLERFAPQFAGYQQHDSQELLAFLLDGLHEDLNRIKKKPYVDNIEVDGRPEEEVAKEAWERHKSRNDSIIVDWFQGQLKSTLTCPDCNRISITFDPFMYLSLPLPIKMVRYIKVTIVFQDVQQKPKRYKVEVNKAGSIKEMRLVLQKITGIQNHFLICDVYNHRFFKVFPEDDFVSSIQERDVIYAYEVDGDLEKYQHITLLQKDMESDRFSNRPLFGVPTFVTVPKEEKVTIKQLYDNILTRTRRYLKEEPTEVPFKILFVDAYGSQEYKDFTAADPEEALDFSGSQRAIALSWSKEMKEKFYDEEKIQDVIEDESCTASEKPEEKITLQSCVEMFTEEEVLGPDDPWYCNKCKAMKEAKKKFDLWKLPPILVIHLKRFRYGSKYYIFREKLDAFVDFPLKDLDLSKYLKNQTDNGIYDLFAVSNHYGSMGGGHYTAYAKNKLNGNWYQFDDSSVSRVDESHVVSSSAYVLFYQRRGTDVATPTPTTNGTTTTAAAVPQTIWNGD